MSQRVFISYSRADVDTARMIYFDLKKEGVGVWMDSEDLKPGQNWQATTEKKIRECDYFLALLSRNSISKRGFVQKELKIALDMLGEVPLSDPFLIPLRKEECYPRDPELSRLHWIDLFPSYPDGIGKIIEFFKGQAPRPKKHLHSPKRVLVVDDQAGGIEWLLDLVTNRGYEIDLATNERAAKSLLDLVRSGRKSYSLAIFDIMLPTADLMELADIEEDFYLASNDAGVRLCRYARQELGLSSKELPIICVSVREDEELRTVLAEFGIPLFSKISRQSRRFIVNSLP